MYGLLIESIVDYIKRKYGNMMLEKVRKNAKLDQYAFSTHQQYSETLFPKLIKSLSEVAGKFSFLIFVADLKPYFSAFKYSRTRHEHVARRFGHRVCKFCWSIWL